LNEDRYSISGVVHKFVSETPLALINECLTLLGQQPESSDYIQTIPVGVEIVDYEYKEDGKQVNIFFSSEYSQIAKTEEILVRAAIVKTLAQFDGDIDYVQFFVDNEALLEKNGSVMVMMKSDFVDSTTADVKDLKERALTLYFASSDGTALVKESLYVHYLNTATAEQVIAESLIAGPLTKTLNQTVSSDTKLNSVSIRDGICYIDFNQRFLEKTNEQSFKINVYSVVNSLCQLSSVEKVMITVDGSTVTEIYDGVDMQSPLEANEDIVLQQSESPLSNNET
jgi:germination protein M